ncbi:MAG: hypothetical protein VX899_03045 [Myxococcota bacterium]|nr:hypothetical protein [Myxococcota bacterium]
MYNLLIALGVSLVAFALGAVAGEWYYGFAPALLVGPPLYFILMRRTGAQVEQIMAQAVSHLQTGRVKEGIATIESARPLGKWQFLVEQQIDAQLGTLEYMQRNYKKARPLLEKAWKRNWQAMAMLAIMDARDQKLDEGLARLDKTELLARNEPLFYAVKVWLLLKGKRTDEAQKVLAAGIEAVDAPDGLKKLQKSVANDKMKRFDYGKTFGQGWYQFFPDQYPNPQVGRRGMRAQPRNARSFPQPRGGGRPR